MKAQIKTTAVLHSE